MEELTLIFKALSDETRLRIVKLLEKGELCVCDIVASLNIVQPKASFHLGVLKEAGLIKDRKQGKWIHYSLNENDLFRRMLMVSVCERADGGPIAEDKKRLEKWFLKSKKSGPGCDIGNGKACCRTERGN
ncbi:MAG TPA: metalloregulator ArsR/SmtB family transcription factor [Nitrospirota bacterium]|nr:metalloregulator ArsR/SmtB family transcription factor [Nitrospirota bacterium]